MEPNPAILRVLAVKTEQLPNDLLTKMILKTIKKKIRSVERIFCGRAGGFFQTPLGYGPAASTQSLAEDGCVCEFSSIFFPVSSDLQDGEFSTSSRVFA